MADLPRELLEPMEEHRIPQISLQVSSNVKRACRTCKWSEMEGKDRVCRFDPPKVAFIPVPTQQRVVHNGQGMTIPGEDRKSTRLNSSHLVISYAVFCLKKKKKKDINVCHDIKDGNFTELH